MNREFGLSAFIMIPSLDSNQFDLNLDVIMQFFILTSFIQKLSKKTNISLNIKYQK